MSLVDDLNACAHTLARVTPAINSYRLTIKEHRRGGLPSSSLPTGTNGGSHEPALPLPDREDRAIDHELKEITLLANEARTRLARVERLVLARVTPAKELPDPGPRHCDNPACAKEVGDPHEPDRRRYMRSRRLCPSCYAHGMRHNYELWPRKADGTLVAGWVLDKHGNPTRQETA